MKKSLFVFSLLLLTIGAQSQSMVRGINLLHSTQTDPTVVISIDSIDVTSFKASFVPNAQCDNYYILAGFESDLQMWAQMMGKTISELIQM